MTSHGNPASFLDRRLYESDLDRWLISVRLHCFGQQMNVYHSVYCPFFQSFWCPDATLISLLAVTHVQIFSSVFRLPRYNLIRIWCNLISRISTRSEKWETGAFLAFLSSFFTCLSTESNLLWFQASLYRACVRFDVVIITVWPDPTLVYLVTPKEGVLTNMHSSLRCTLPVTSGGINGEMSLVQKRGAMYLSPLCNRRICNVPIGELWGRFISVSGFALGYNLTICAYRNSFSVKIAHLEVRFLAKNRFFFALSPTRLWASFCGDVLECYGR